MKTLRGSLDYLELVASLKGEIAPDEEGLTFFTVNIPTSCPHCCAICALGSGGGINWACLGKPVLSPEERNEQIVKAHEAGAQTIVIIGDGEPLWQPPDGRPGFCELVRPVLEQAHSLGMGTIMFTTLNFLSQEQAEFLRDHGVSIFISLHSLDPEIYRRSTGNGDIFRVIENLRLLRAVYGPNEVIGNREITRIGVNFTVTLLNESGVEVAKAFAHSNGLLFISNCVMPEGKVARERVWLERVGNAIDQARLDTLVKTYSDTGGQSSLRTGKCSYGYRGVAMDTDGLMMLCGYKSGPTGLMPNIKAMTVEDLRHFHRLIIQASWRHCREADGSCIRCITRATAGTQANLMKAVRSRLKKEARVP